MLPKTVSEVPKSQCVGDGMGTKHTIEMNLSVIVGVAFGSTSSGLHLSPMIRGGLREPNRAEPNRTTGPEPLTCLGS